MTKDNEKEFCKTISVYSVKTVIKVDLSKKSWRNVASSIFCNDTLGQIFHNECHSFEIVEILLQK